MPGKNLNDFLGLGKNVSRDEENVDIFSTEEKEDYVSKEEYFNEFGFSSDEQMPASPNFGNFMKPTSAETIEELNSSGAALMNKTKSGTPSTEIDFMSQMQKMYTSLSQGEEETEEGYYPNTPIQNAPGAEQDPSSESHPFQSAPAATLDSEESSQEKEGAAVGRVPAETGIEDESLDFTYVDFEEQEEILDSFEEANEEETSFSGEIDEDVQNLKETLLEAFDEVEEETEVDDAAETVNDLKENLLEAFDEVEEPKKEEIPEENNDITDKPEADYWNYIDGLLDHFDDGRIHSTINSSYGSTDAPEKTSNFFGVSEETSKNVDVFETQKDFDEASVFNLPEEEDEGEEIILMDYEDLESEESKKERPVVWKVLVALLAAFLVIAIIYFATSSKAVSMGVDSIPAIVSQSSAVIDINFNPVF